MIEWDKMWLPDTPLLEIIVRGSVVYLTLFCLLRFVFRREAGTVSINDLLVVVLIADAAQNAMAAEYTSITDGIILVMTIMAWSWTLDFLAFHVPFIAKFVHPAPLLLIKDGKMNLRNMRKELISKEELLSQLREQGIEDLANVKKAYMEGDGHISIIQKNGENNKPPETPIA